MDCMVKRELKVAAIIQARIGSTRLPGKVVMDLCGKTVLARVIERVRAAKTVTDICVATSKDTKNDAVVTESGKNKASCFKGSENDVLDRYDKAAAELRADIIVRVTADNPLTDPSFIDLCVNKVANEGYDFAAMKNIPYGSGAEVMRRDVLTTLSRIAKDASDREHVTSYLYKNTAGFKTVFFEPEPDLRRPDVRLTLDTAEDYDILSKFFGKFSGVDTGKIKLKDAIDFLGTAHKDKAVRS
jgi:spore coat polysaccharide biosynthesis protein SpsF